QEQPRCRAQAPLAGLDRRVRHSGSRLQGRTHGGPDGLAAVHRAEPHRPGGRPGAEPDSRAWRDSRPGRRARAGSRRREEHPGEGWCREVTTVDVVSVDGDSTATVELPEDVFDAQANIPLMHQVVVAQLAAARQGTAKTKNRGEVRGGGKKPYKQKGTGRARQGSTRAPQFAG